MLCYTYVNIKLCHIPEKNKSDEDKCFNSNHKINDGHRLSILLSFLFFNAMLVHGYYPSDVSVRRTFF